MRLRNLNCCYNICSLYDVLRHCKLLHVRNYLARSTTGQIGRQRHIMCHKDSETTYLRMLKAYYEGLVTLAVNYLQTIHTRHQAEMDKRTTRSDDPSFTKTPNQAFSKSTSSAVRPLRCSARLPEGRKHCSLALLTNVKQAKSNPHVLHRATHNPKRFHTCSRFIFRTLFAPTNIDFGLPNAKEVATAHY